MLTFFATAGQVYAATPSSAPLSANIASMQKTCQEIAIVSLSTKTHSTDCLKQRPKGITPKISVRGNDCSGNFYGLTLETEIFNYNWTANLCFYGNDSQTGTDYLGVNIFQVNEIINENARAGWFRWYPAAAFRVLGGNGGYYYWGDGNTGVEITQLCVGSSIAGRC